MLLREFVNDRVERKKHGFKIVRRWWWVNKKAFCLCFPDGWMGASFFFSKMLLNKTKGNLSSVWITWLQTVDPTWPDQAFGKSNPFFEVSYVKFPFTERPNLYQVNEREARSCVVKLIIYIVMIARNLFSISNCWPFFKPVLSKLVQDPNDSRQSFSPFIQVHYKQDICLLAPPTRTEKIFSICQSLVHSPDMMKNRSTSFDCLKMQSWTSLMAWRTSSSREISWFARKRQDIGVHSVELRGWTIGDWLTNWL